MANGENGRGANGRPTRLNDKLQADICEAVALGNYPSVAARARGVPDSTFYYWKARGEEGGSANARYVKFLEALTRAEAEAEEKAVTALSCAFEDDWRAASEFLRRRQPDRWSTTDRIEGKVKHEHEVEGLSEAIQGLMAELAAAREA